MARYIDADHLKSVIVAQDFPHSLVSIATLKTIIDSQSTADVAPIVHGHWNKTCVPDVYQCNHCKKAVKMDFLCDSAVLREYCPCCGARMDEKETEQ